MEAEVDRVGVAPLERLAVVHAQQLLAAAEIEVVRVRQPIGEVADKRHEADEPADQRDAEAPLAGARELLAVCAEERVRRAQQARPEHLLDLADLDAVRLRHVVAGARVEALAGVDAQQLAALALVDVEADVLLERDALLLDEADALAGLAVLAGEEELVAVDDGGPHLAEQEVVLVHDQVGRDHARRAYGTTTSLLPGPPCWRSQAAPISDSGTRSRSTSIRPSAA